MTEHYDRKEVEELRPSDFKHFTPIQLRFNDVDILGHVNNNSQFAIFDIGKTEFYNSLRGYLQDWHRIEAVIANINCSFLKSILFTDPVEVRTRVIRIGEKSFTLQQMIHNTETGDICSVSESVMVSIDWETKASKPIPEKLRIALEAWR